MNNNNTKYKDHKDFIGGKFHSYQPGKISIWIPKAEISKVVTPKGDIAFAVAMKKNPMPGKSNAYAWVSKKEAPSIPDFQPAPAPVSDKPEPQASLIPETEQHDNIPF